MSSNGNGHQNGNGKLTHKQQLFIAAYLGPARGNATEAARLAGYSGNDNTLHAMGAENLQKPTIAAAISQRTERKIMSGEEVMRELSLIAFADPSAKDSAVSTRDKLEALRILSRIHGLEQQRRENVHDQRVKELRQTLSEARRAAEDNGLIMADDEVWDEIVRLDSTAAKYRDEVLAK